MLNMNRKKKDQIRARDLLRENGEQKGRRTAHKRSIGLIA